MPTASAAEPAQQRGAETPAESVGCWWKTQLVQTCRSLVALKNAAEDGRVSDQINRVSGRLNFLVRHASNFDGKRGGAGAAARCGNACRVGGLLVEDASGADVQISPGLEERGGGWKGFRRDQ